MEVAAQDRTGWRQVMCGLWSTLNIKALLKSSQAGYFWIWFMAAITDAMFPYYFTGLLICACRGLRHHSWSLVICLLLTVWGGQHHQMPLLPGKYYMYSELLRCLAVVITTKVYCFLLLYSNYYYKNLPSVAVIPRYLSSSSATAERPYRRVGQFWPKYN